MHGSDADLHSLAARKFSEQRFADALEIYEALSERGYVQCQVYAGWMLFEGIGVMQQRERALVHLRNAASSNKPIAMFYLGRALTILEQHEEAIDWYRKAASQDYPPAVFRVGVSHLLGQGTLRDASKAKQCFLQAAKAGHILAKGQLARLYLTGKAGLLMIPVGAFLSLRLIFETWKVATTDKEFIEELVG